MDRIDGPLDYHRYPPRDRRRSRTAATPRASAPRAAASSPAQHSPAPHTEHVRNARRTPRPTHADEEQQLHLRLDPADIAERHTPPQRGRKARRSRTRRTPSGPPWWKRARRCAGILLLVGIVELGAAALTAPDFRVHAITVSGLDITNPSDVEHMAADLVGQNWIRANTKATIEEVQTLPAVRTAHVERTLQWPPTLTLRVEERRPFARVGAGDRWWVVDESGVPFRRAGAEDERLYAVTSKAFKPTLGRALPPASWQPVVTFARALSQDGNNSDGSPPEDDSANRSTPGRNAGQWALRRIYFDEDGFASLRLEGGAHDELLVRLGAGRWPEKLQRAHQALAWFERTGSRASELNLVSYNMPVWTPRTASGDENSSGNQSDAADAGNQRSDITEDTTEDVQEPAGSFSELQPSSREG